MTTATATRIGRLPVTFQTIAGDITKPLADVHPGTTVDTTATITTVQMHGTRATVILNADGNDAALRVDADRMRKFADRLQPGQTVTLRGTVGRLAGGMRVIDLLGIAPKV